MIRRLLKWSLVLTLAAAVAGGVAAYLAWIWYQEALEPVAEGSGQDREFRVSPGQGTAEVADNLEREGLIRRALAFRLYSRLEGKDGQLKAGLYLLSDAWSTPEILSELVRGEVISFTVTVPEGLRVSQITDLVLSRQLFELDEWDEALAWARSEESPLADIVPDDDRIVEPLEGYLFPDTYRLAEETSARDLVKMMIGQLLVLLDEAAAERAQELGLSLHEVVTLASIVEKEAMVEEELERIAGVFHNRLRLGMLLGACPTVVYLVERYPLTVQDLEIDSPYNTYAHPGLPPGPIASPGRGALQATLNPEEVDYLYFVARGDGTHAFSRTYAEHLRNQRIYQGR